jgi:hypothetical protein
MTLSRSFLNGSLAIAGIAAAFGFATEAQAATFTVTQVNTPNFTHTEGDKVFSDFVVPTATGQFQGGDQVTINDNGGSFSVVFNPGATGANNLSAAGRLSYKVTILPSYINVFNTADISTRVTTTGSVGSRVATRSFAATSLSPATLSTTNASAASGTFSSPLQSINVTDSWSFAGTGNLGARNTITGLTANFVQDPELPELILVPEPSAVLGLLALGLCGTLVSRKKG